MRRLITELQSMGVRINGDLAGRSGGAGPAEGRAFLINRIPVSIPLTANFVSRSPYSLKDSPSSDQGFDLYKDRNRVDSIRVVPEPQFYQQTTKDGIPYRQIALLHGKDCLATTVLQRCVHWKTGNRCHFCATEASLSAKQTIARKTPVQLAEVARAAKETDGITHMVLTSGTGDPSGSEIAYLAECVRAVKTCAGIPVQVQIAPPEDLMRMDELADAGVDALGIHIESFDFNVLSRVAPIKAKIGLDHYEKAWKHAVELFGVNQVSSFIIAGLGEDPATIAWGGEYLADLGVYPFVVPLRPVPGSEFTHAVPPHPDIMARVYDAVAQILKEKGLGMGKIKAGCARCGACSALPAYQTESSVFTCHSARNQMERCEAFRIRDQVFVREQGLFESTDRDEHDQNAIHLVAKQDGRVIGTVRVFQETPGKDRWVGGRLAVEKDFRSTSAGSILVKEAMKRVKKKGCKIFTAYIQEPNIPFFLKLGWSPLSPVEKHFGRPHQKMQADLNRVPKEI